MTTKIHRSPAVQAIFDLRSAINEEWNTWAAATPEGTRLRKIATAIFLREWPHCDPDEVVMGTAGAEFPTSFFRLGKGTVAIRFPILPAWATYLNDARDALKAVEIAQ